MELEAKFITSKHNQLYKEWLAINKRKLVDFCLVEGQRIVAELFAASDFAMHVRELVVAASFWQLQVDYLTNLFLASECQPRIYVLPDQLYKQVAATVQSQGIIAVLNLAKLNAKPFNSAASTPSTVYQPASSPKERELVLVLDQVQDPGNLGNIIRSCAAFGVRNIYSLAGTVHAWQDKVMRASMGGIFKLRITENCLATDLFARLKAANYSLLAAGLAETNFFAYLKSCSPTKLQKVALVVGNEGNGISPTTSAAADAILSIPMLADSESLNVASATAICLAELRFH